MEIEVKGRIESFLLKASNTKSWIVKVCNTPLELEPQIKRELVRITEEWVARFPIEKTLAFSFGVPSLISRIDFTLDENKECEVIEVEESPRGIGLAILTVPNFKEQLMKLYWKKVVVVEEIPKGDDFLWTKTISPTEIPSNVWIAPRVSIPPSLIEKSIWPVKYRENKKYGIDWLWKNIPKVNLPKLGNEAANKLNWEGIVLKSDGARTEKVKIVVFKKGIKKILNWIGEDALGRLGIWSWKKAFAEASTWENVYVQKFYFPLKVILNDERTFGIFRYFLGFDVRKKQWRHLGGFLNVRKSMLIHGSKDAIFIPVI